MMNNQQEMHQLLSEAESNIAQFRYDAAQDIILRVRDNVLRTGKGDISNSSTAELTLVDIQATRLLAVIHFRRGQIDSALEQFNKSLAMAQSADAHELIAKIHGDIGVVYRNVGEFQQAIHYLEKAIELFTILGNTEAVIANTGNMGLVYQSLSDHARALEFMSQALSLAEQVGKTASIATNTGNIGQVYQSLSDFPRALEYMQRALELYELEQNKRGVAGTLNNIGMVYRELNDYQRALEYFQKARDINEELGNKSGIAVVLSSMGAVYSDLDDLDRALECVQQSLSISEELGRKSEVAGALGNMGYLFQKHRDYSRALEYNRKAAVLFEELGSKIDIAINLGNLAQLFIEAQYDDRDPAAAEEHLLRAIELSTEVGDKHHRLSFHKTLSELYEAQHRTDAALEHFKMYHQLEKEVQSEEAWKQMRVLEQQKQISEREKALTIERERANATTAVLHKVLPQSIAERLVNGEKIADYFQNISILFADIVGFTPIASRMPAGAVLAFLNHVFEEFDSIIERHGCEKIKTIGDGYLAIAGAPIECVDHAERIAHAALDMMKHIELPQEIRKHLPDGVEFNIRIGIHCGPVFGGIVGSKRFVYDIYSDAVNVAARMESHGESGRIHCSENYVHHLQNQDETFFFIERDEIEIKGKGLMKTYFLERNEPLHTYVNQG